MNKIAIVGAGRVGEAAAQVLAKEELCRELALIDVREGAAAGTALDLQESGPLFNFDTRLTGHADIKAVEGADMVIVTAGLPRKPGMSRSDVLDANVAIMRGVVDAARELAPDALLLIVSNPVDVLTHYAWKRSGWDRRRVFGLSGVLDAARMAGFIAMESGFSVKGVSAMVIGGHGDTMLPLPRYSCVNGIPITQLLDDGTLARITERTRQGGAEILALKKNSSAYDAPGAAIAAMVDAVSRDRRRIMPCVAILDGEYGEQGIAMGVPVVLSARGVERVIELELTDPERRQIRESCAAIREDIGRIAG